jgi:hypothetical protein
MQIEPTKEKRRRGRPPNPNPPAPVQLRIPRELYEEMKRRAKFQGLPCAAWIRMCCLRELRRKST